MPQHRTNPAAALILGEGLSIAEAARRAGVSHAAMSRRLREAVEAKTERNDRADPPAAAANGGAAPAGLGPVPLRRRRICFDTETTGLSWRMGDRVVEIGAVEMNEALEPVRRFQAYLNPQRSVPWSAYRVHGLSTEFLSDKPLFSDVADEFLAFVEGAEIIAHNAAFDRGFLNMELGRAGRPLLEDAGCTVTCTLRMARRVFPHQSNTLDVLCTRLGVDRSSRTHHGALLDSEILCGVYRELLNRV